jgi:hypothetical protein
MPSVLSQQNDHHSSEGTVVVCVGVLSVDLSFGCHMSIMTKCKRHNNKKSIWIGNESCEEDLDHLLHDQ